VLHIVDAKLSNPFEISEGSHDDDVKEKSFLGISWKPKQEKRENQEEEKKH
jgi:hypothetical protein